MKFTPVCCSNCGTRFGITETLLQLRTADRKTVYCPNGHALISRGDKIKIKAKAAA